MLAVYLSDTGIMFTNGEQIPKSVYDYKRVVYCIDLKYAIVSHGIVIKYEDNYNQIGKITYTGGYIIEEIFD